jgi:hypothetical protein
MRGKIIMRMIPPHPNPMYRYQAGEYEAAIQLYTDSLAYLTPDTGTLCSRALSHYAMGQYYLCIQVTTWVKKYRAAKYLSPLAGL